jgi:hypothetical protein
MFLKLKNKFIVIFERYGHFTVNRNIDLDPKIDPYFDQIIFVFVSLFVYFTPKQDCCFANQQNITLTLCTIQF